MKFTDFSSQIQFPTAEEATLSQWRLNDTFRKSVENRPETNRYSFYDGPPFATGLPHYGHLLAGTIKDVVPRYWTMRGFRVERRFGWDCHGLPVEYEIEKKIGLAGRGEIEAYGVAKFNEECRSIVLRYTTEWRQVVERMGRWVDFSNEYKTMDLSFMESVWAAFKKLWDAGLIYEGYRVVPYSWRIAAPLSNFEANQNYRDVQDPSLTVRVQLDNGLVALVWTTTPWTLPSNLALAVDPDGDYTILREKGDNNPVSYVMLEPLVANYWPKSDEIERLGSLKGQQLVGIGYQPLFPFFENKKVEGAFRILPGDFVTADTGTGIVHIAPAYGEDDFRLCQQHGIVLVDPVDDEGKFTADVPPYAGIMVKDADKTIISDLKQAGKVHKHDTLVHSYPFCYRSDTPLIYKSISAWYVRVEAIKERLVQNNQQILWVPAHLRDGRFGNWLENARDWNISRNRFWGNPLPIWRNQETGETICVGSRAELEALSGQSVDDLHKHIVDDVVIPSPTGQGVLRRIPEVLDCWFESGSMPYAQEHYPFENKEKFEQGFPADFIAEGLDQTRGWFYTLMVLSTALFDKPAFKNVIVNGLVLAEDGRKMSKRLQNYPDPSELVREHGADALRIYMLQSAAVRGEELRFSEAGVREMVRRVLLPWWNSVSFLATYAQVDGWDPETDTPAGMSPNELDVWVQAKMEDLKTQVEQEMSAYELSRVVPPLLQFIDDLTNWYIRRSRRRFWKEGKGEDKNFAYATLYGVLLEFSELMAPFMPFLSDYTYQVLRRTPDTLATESVHLRDFPRARALTQMERDIEGRIDVARIVAELGRELRASHRIKTRQPLGLIRIGVPSAVEAEWVRASEEIILDELNIKRLEVQGDPTRLAKVVVKPNLPKLGPKLGKQLKDLMIGLRNLSDEDAKTLAFGGTVQVAGIELGPDDVLVELQPAESGFLVAARGRMVVAIDPHIDEFLRLEGLARELVNRVQRMRKDLDLPVDARIILALTTENEAFRGAIEANLPYIEQETLCQLRFEETSELELVKEQDIEGEQVTVGIKRTVID